MNVNNLSNNGVKNASISELMIIMIIDIINANKYLPKKLLKFKLSFLSNAFKNFTDT